MSTHCATHAAEGEQFRLGRRDHREKNVQNLSRLDLV